MGVFEYIMVLVSIVIGLAVAELLAGLLRLLKSPAEERPYWVHSLWVLQTFIWLILNWWYRFDLQGSVQWTLAKFAVILLPTLLLFLASGLVFPNPGQEGDLRHHYFRVRRQLFAVFILLAIANSAEASWVLGYGFWSSGDWARLPNVVVFGVLLWTDRPRVHELLTPALFIFNSFLLVYYQTPGAVAWPF